MSLLEPQKEKVPEKDFTEPPPTGFRLFWLMIRTNFLKIVMANLLFLLFCLPVITIPAALTSLSKISLSLLRFPTCYVWSEFWGTFKKEFRRASLCGWGHLLLTGLLLVSIRVYAQFAAQTALLYFLVALCFLCLLFLVVMGFYLYPMLSTLDLPIRKIIKNAAGLTVLCFKNNLITLVCVTLILLFVEASLPMSIILILFLVPSIINLICTYCAWLGFQKYNILIEKSDLDI